MTDEECYEINKQMKSQGYTEKEIADTMGISVNGLRRITRDVSYRIRVDKMIQAIELKEQGYGPRAIGRLMGINESSVCRLLDSSSNIDYHRDIETTRIRRLFDDGYNYSSIACTLGYDENHVKWILCDEETITPVILQITDELIDCNLETRPCTLTQIMNELQDYYCDSYNVTKELVDYIIRANGYGFRHSNSVKHNVYFK